MLMLKERLSDDRLQHLGLMLLEACCIWGNGWRPFTWSGAVWLVVGACCIGLVERLDQHAALLAGT